MPSDIILDSYPGAYGQVLTNLIFNAVTHGFGDELSGRMLIEAHRVGPEQIEITFSDDGGGIPEDVQRHVFDPFFTTRRAQGCTGLGLYIVHNLVTDQLGGKIALVFAPGKGASIRMTLPLLAPGASRAVRTGRTPQTMVNVAAVGHGATGDAAQYVRTCPSQVEPTMPERASVLKHDGIRFDNLNF